MFDCPLEGRPRAILGCAFLVAIIGCRGSLDPESVSVLAEQHGTVERGNRGRWDPAAAGARFEIGNGVRTGPRSGATVHVGSQSWLRVGADTYLRFAVGDGPGSLALGIDTGSAEFETAGIGFFTTTVGLLRLDPGSLMRASANTKYARYELARGRATLQTTVDATTIGPGEGLRIAVGGSGGERYQASVRKGDAGSP